jgi:hypothetical protein
MEAKLGACACFFAANASSELLATSCHETIDSEPLEFKTAVVCARHTDFFNPSFFVALHLHVSAFIDQRSSIVVSSAVCDPRAT